jgi:hypothetical protein
VATRRRTPSYPLEHNRDHARPRRAPAPAGPAVEARLTDLISPVAFALGDEYRRLGLRERILALPVMVAVVLTMIWRQVPSVAELTRLLEREGLLWAAKRAVSAQTLALRRRCLPAALFHRVLMDLLPLLTARAAARARPLPPVVVRARSHFAAVWAVDGSTLEALFKRVGLRREASGTVEGGKLAALLDLATKLPVHRWLDDDANANAKRFLARLKAVLRAPTLLVMDRGFSAFDFFDWLTEQPHGFVTRARANAALTVDRVLVETPTARDRIVRLGKYRSSPCRHPVRLVEVQVQGSWRGYLTNVLDPQGLPAADVVELYARRWRVEEAFLLTKRLLGLS